MKYRIYTDGACSGNPGPGGWGAVIFDQKDNQKNISGSEKDTTNNCSLEDQSNCMHNFIQLLKKNCCP